MRRGEDLAAIAAIVLYSHVSWDDDGIKKKKSFLLSSPSLSGGRGFAFSL
jgi:hypothetical protein